MRIVIVITVLAVAGALARYGWEAHDDSFVALSKRLPFQTEVSETEVALIARCGDLDSWQRHICEEELSDRFAAGNATPEAVLRMHCTRVDSVWSQTEPDPPALCAARFGGWLSS